MVQSVFESADNSTAPGRVHMLKDRVPGLGTVMAFNLTVRFRERQMLYRHAVILDQRMLLQRRRFNFHCRVEEGSVILGPLDKNSDDCSAHVPTLFLSYPIEKSSIALGRRPLNPMQILARSYRGDPIE